MRVLRGPALLVLRECFKSVRLQSKQLLSRNSLKRPFNSGQLFLIGYFKILFLFKITKTVIEGEYFGVVYLVNI